MGGYALGALLGWPIYRVSAHFMKRGDTGQAMAGLDDANAFKGTHAAKLQQYLDIISLSARVFKDKSRK